MTEIKQLQENEIKAIYNERMRHDFPPMELRPYASMKKLGRDGLYSGYGYYEDGRMLAYACLYTGTEFYLLDLFAVLTEYRDNGIGSRFIRELNEQLPAKYGTFIETESASPGTKEDENLIRRKRIDFYLRNGAQRTGLRSFLFGVNYDILFLPACGAERLTEDRLSQGLKDLYMHLYRPVYGRLCKVFD
ncbi:MAG: GNAT family N-acetyltransferase [Clostridiales bacterium]|nr:GNAT family N-acetyltransferase [Clostridiales bacterium]